MRLYFPGIACVLLSGCFTPTSPVPSASPDVRPSVVLLDAAATTPREGAGAILVTRDTGFTGKACTFDVSLDGKPVAGLRAGEQVTLYADPGERIVGVQVRKEGLCTTRVAQLAVQVGAGVTKKVRVGMDASFDIRIEPSAY